MQYETNRDKLIFISMFLIDYTASKTEYYYETPYFIEN